VSGRWSLGYVKDKYSVPVKRGMRVRTEEGRDGVVTCGDGAHVRVRIDGERRSGIYHPLSLDYGDGITPAQRLAHHNARIEAWNDRLNQRITVEEYRERMTRPLVSA
jgi:hypothetical protein